MIPACCSRRCQAGLPGWVVAESDAIVLEAHAASIFLAADVSSRSNYDG